jgi:hypothetical protein
VIITFCLPLVYNAADLKRIAYETLVQDESTKVAKPIITNKYGMTISFLTGYNFAINLLLIKLYLPYYLL